MGQRRPFPERFFDKLESDPLNRAKHVGEESGPTSPPRLPTAPNGTVFASGGSEKKGRLPPGGAGGGEQPKRKALLVTRMLGQTQGLEELEKHLSGAWKVVGMRHLNFLHPARPEKEQSRTTCFSALISIEKNDGGQETAPLN